MSIGLPHRARLGCAALLAAALVGVKPASGATSTANLSVSVEVQPTCNVGNGTLNFGTYSPISGSLVDASTTFQLTCTKGTSATIALGQGANYSSGRRMSSGTEFLTYELYKESARTNVWGDSIGTTVSVVASSSAAQTISVYGRVAASQTTVGVGTYTDSVLITVTF